MDSRTVQQAVQASGQHPDAVCSALIVILPLLSALKDASSGWKPWVKLALGMVISALESYEAQECSLLPPGPIMPPEATT